jgi:type II secretory pathway component PulF
VPIAAIFIVVRYTPKTGPLRTLLDEVTLMIPLLGRAARQLALSRFCRTFQMLYATGTVPIAECVRKAAELSGNTIMRRRLMGGTRSAEAGQSIGEGFPASLPAEFVASWQVGEESGKLDETAVRLADQYAENSERLMALLAVWIPRLVYVLVSLYLVYNILGGFFGYINQINDLSNAP